MMAQSSLRLGNFWSFFRNLLIFKIRICLTVSHIYISCSTNISTKWQNRHINECIKSLDVLSVSVNERDVVIVSISKLSNGSGRTAIKSARKIQNTKQNAS